MLSFNCSFTKPTIIWKASLNEGCRNEAALCACVYRIAFSELIGKGSAHCGQHHPLGKEHNSGEMSKHKKQAACSCSFLFVLDCGCMMSLCVSSSCPYLPTIIDCSLELKVKSIFSPLNCLSSGFLSQRQKQTRTGTLMNSIFRRVPSDTLEELTMYRGSPLESGRKKKL